MTELIAMLTTGKGTWIEVSRLISSHQFSKVLLLTNQFGQEKYKPNDSTELIVLDFTKPMEILVADIINSVKEKISGEELAVNFASGNGKEHMAFISAIMKLGVGFRLVGLTPEGVKEI